MIDVKGNSILIFSYIIYVNRAKDFQNVLYLHVLNVCCFQLSILILVVLQKIEINIYYSDQKEITTES